MSCSSKNCLFVYRVKRYCSGHTATSADSNGYETFPVGTAACSLDGGSTATRAGKIKVDFMGLDCSRPAATFPEGTWYIGKESGDTGQTDVNGTFCYYYYRDTSDPSGAAITDPCESVAELDEGGFEGDNAYDIDYTGSDDCTCDQTTVETWFSTGSLKSTALCDWSYEALWKGSPSKPLPTPSEADKVTCGCSTTTATATESYSPTFTHTATETVTEEHSYTFTSTATATLSTPSETATFTATETATASDTPTYTATETTTETSTNTTTATETATGTDTPTYTATETTTETSTNTETATATETATVSDTPTYTATETTTETATETASGTASYTATQTLSFAASAKAWRCSEVATASSLSGLTEYKLFIPFLQHPQAAALTAAIHDKVNNVIGWTGGATGCSGVNRDYVVPVKIDGECYLVFETASMNVATCESWLYGDSSTGPWTQADYLWSAGDSYSNTKYAKSLSGAQQACGEFCPTSTATYTATHSFDPTWTETATGTETLTATATATEVTPTFTATDTATVTLTGTETSSFSPTFTSTFTSTATVTDELTDTETFTATETGTLTPTETLTGTGSETATFTATVTTANTPEFAVLGQLPNCAAVQSTEWDKNKTIRLPDNFMVGLTSQDAWRQWNAHSSGGSSAFSFNQLNVDDSGSSEGDCFWTHKTNPAEDWRSDFYSGSGTKGIAFIDLSLYAEAARGEGPNAGHEHPGMVLVFMQSLAGDSASARLAKCDGNYQAFQKHWLEDGGGGHANFQQGDFNVGGSEIGTMIQRWFTDIFDSYTTVRSSSADFADASGHVASCVVCSGTDAAKPNLTITVGGVEVAKKGWTALDHPVDCAKSTLKYGDSEKSQDTETTGAGTYQVTLSNKNNTADDFNKYKFKASFKSECYLDGTDSKTVDITPLTAKSSRGQSSLEVNDHSIYPSWRCTRNFIGSDTDPKNEENIVSGGYGGVNGQHMEYEHDSISELGILPTTNDVIMEKLGWRMQLGSKIVNTFDASSAPAVKLTQSDGTGKTKPITCEAIETFKNVNKWTTDRKYSWTIELKVDDGSNSGGTFPSQLDTEEVKKYTIRKRSEIMDADGNAVGSKDNQKLKYTLSMLNNGIGALWVSNWTAKIYRSSDAGSIGSAIVKCSAGNKCDYLDMSSIGTKNSFTNMNHARIASPSPWPVQDGGCKDCSRLGGAGGGLMHEGSLHWNLYEMFNDVSKSEGSAGGFYTMEHEFTVINRDYGNGTEPAFNQAGATKTTVQFTIEVAEDFGVPHEPSIEATQCDAACQAWLQQFQNGWNWF